MDFNEIKKIVDRDGKVVILDNQKAYVVSKYALSEEKPVVIEEDKNEGLKLEDLPF
ncbi:MAG: hypothetical protein PHH88_00520 [Candidatus Pacebacteria bacterium]|nr:hypothetical protein [Candidatus Paceibacterota bacterium]MDD4333624.1 hypothetical protein [Candidatus Paceibacterota bacterium]